MNQLACHSSVSWNPEFKIKIIKWLYTMLFSFSIPFILIRLLWRSRKNPMYRQRWLERFGIFKTKVQPNGLWIHAVSVGESVAAIQIVQEFQKHSPNIPVTITTTTPTGSDRVQKALGEKVTNVYFPYDIPILIENFLKRIQPKCCVIMETELWPNCIWTCKKNNVPIILANACLSLRSLKRYGYIQTIMQSILECLDIVSAQTVMDGDRYQQLGLKKEQLNISGNIKFDVSIPVGIEQKAEILRKTWGIERPVWIAASTHHNEEEIILETFLEVKKRFNNALLILVPRHPERFEKTAQLIKTYRFNMARRSLDKVHNSNRDPNISLNTNSNLNTEMVTHETEVYLGDTMGELYLLYAASDVAFVGGSLVPIGGHNMLEPASLGIPVITGPYLHEFIEISELLLNAGALIKISGEDVNKNDNENNKNNSYIKNNLCEAVCNWFENSEERKRIGQSGKAVVEQNKGAVKKVVNIIEEYVKY